MYMWFYRPNRCTVTFTVALIFCFLAANKSLAQTTPPTKPAMESIISYYAFENKGQAVSETFNLNGPTLEIPIQAAWFDWKCTAYREVDGTSAVCRKNNDAVDIKVYCRADELYAARAMKVGRDPNFVTIEVTCVRPVSKKPSAAKAKANDVEKISTKSNDKKAQRSKKVPVKTVNKDPNEGSSPAESPEPDEPVESAPPTATLPKIDEPKKAAPPAATAPEEEEEPDEPQELPAAAAAAATAKKPTLETTVNKTEKSAAEKKPEIPEPAAEDSKQ